MKNIWQMIEMESIMIKLIIVLLMEKYQYYLSAPHAVRSVKMKAQREQIF